MFQSSKSVKTLRKQHQGLVKSSSQSAISRSNGQVNLGASKSVAAIQSRLTDSPKPKAGVPDKISIQGYNADKFQKLLQQFGAAKRELSKKMNRELTEEEATAVDTVVTRVHTQMQEHSAQTTEASLTTSESTTFVSETSMRPSDFLGERPEELSEQLFAQLAETLNALGIPTNQEVDLSLLQETASSKEPTSNDPALAESSASTDAVVRSPEREFPFDSSLGDSPAPWSGSNAQSRYQSFPGLEDDSGVNTAELGTFYGESDPSSSSSSSSQSYYLTPLGYSPYGATSGYYPSYGPVDMPNPMGLNQRFLETSQSSKADSKVAPTIAMLKYCVAAAAGSVGRAYRVDVIYPPRPSTYRPISSTARQAETGCQAPSFFKGFSRSGEKGAARLLLLWNKIQNEQSLPKILAHTKAFLDEPSGGWTYDLKSAGTKQQSGKPTLLHYLALNFSFPSMAPTPMQLFENACSKDERHMKIFKNTFIFNFENSLRTYGLQTIGLGKEKPDYANAELPSSRPGASRW